MLAIPIVKIILIIVGVTIIVGGIGGYLAFQYRTPKVEVEISGTPIAPIEGIKMDIPGYTGEKIGDITWTGGSEPLPEPFGASIPVFKPSQIAGVTKLDQPFMRSVAFMTGAAPAAVSDFYSENLPKNGWVIESSKPPTVKAIYSTMKFQKKSANLTETITVIAYNTASAGKMVFSITYTKTEKE